VQVLKSPVSVLLQTALAHLDEAELQLDGGEDLLTLERVLDFTRFSLRMAG
jgi:hypothetical protein